MTGKLETLIKLSRFLSPDDLLHNTIMHGERGMENKKTKPKPHLYLFHTEISLKEALRWTAFKPLMFHPALAS